MCIRDRNGLEGKFSQWKEVREQLAGNRERLSRLSEQEAGERERKDALEQSFLEMEGAETRAVSYTHLDVYKRQGQGGEA